MTLIFFSMLAACSSAPASPSESTIPTPANTAANVTAGATTQELAPLPSTPTQQIEWDSLSATPQLSPTPKPDLLPLPPINRTLYALEATLDYASHSLVVEEHVTYTNTTSEHLSSILLVVEAQRYPGAFQLTGVFDQSGKRLTQFRLKDTYLTLYLNQALAPGDKLEFSLSYSLQLPDTRRLPHVRPYPLGYTDLQTNFGDWYPFIPPYAAGKGWLVHDPAFYGEHLVYAIADFDVDIRFTGKQTSLVIAAGAPAETDGDWQRYQHTAARNFAWSASPYYQVVTQTVEVAEDATAIAASYYFPFHVEAGKSLLDTMVQALPVYSRLFGAYAHPMLVGVQANLLDGMEYDGLYFLSTDFYNWHKDTQADFLVAMAAHETAHQWWYALVGSDQAMQPWLDEALCTYSERLYYENVAPGALDWWWAYRVNYYQPEGWVDLSIYDVPGVVGQYRAYRDPVYLKGALFLEELRTLIGDAAFFDALRSYASRYAYRQAEAADFFAIVRQHTTQDLGPLLGKYFLKPE